MLAWIFITGENNSVTIGEVSKNEILNGSPIVRCARQFMVQVEDTQLQYVAPSVWYFAAVANL